MWGSYTLLQMVIKIEEPRKEGQNRQLKLKKLLPAEYAIISKEIAEPMTGTSQYGTWSLFTVKVHEFVSVNTKTLEKTTEKPNESMSFFPSAKAAEQLAEIPVGVRVKITAEEIEGNQGTFTKYVLEKLDKVEEGASAKNTAADVSVEDRIKALKSAGVNKEQAVQILSGEFDLPDTVLDAKYESL